MHLTACVIGEDIYGHYTDTSQKPVTETHFFKALKRLFPSVTTARSKSQGRRRTVYKGLAFFPLEDLTQPTTSLEELVPFVKKRWPMCHLDHDKLVVSMKSDAIFQGQQVLKEVTVTRKGNVSCNINGNSVNMAAVGVSTCVQLRYNEVMGALSALSKLKVCLGFSDQCGEMWGLAEDENSHSQRQHSATCHRLVQVMAKSRTCLPCFNRSRYLAKKPREMTKVGQPVATEELMACLKGLGLPEHLGDLIAEQAQNTNVPPTRRRWSTKYVSHNHYLQGIS